MPPILTVLLVTVGSLLSLFLLLMLLYVLLFVRPRRPRAVDPTLLCDYAHRGLHGDGVPENSLAAFALACEAGYGIELDVQLSADGEVMVFHDYTLVRMTGDGRRLCELSAAELGALRLADTEEIVPTLAEVLALVDGRVPLLVELKGENFDTALCEQVAAYLVTYSGPYCIESFNPLLIKGMRKHLPEAFCGLLYTNVVRDKQKGSLLNRALSLMAFNFLCRPDFIAYNEIDRRTLPVHLTTGLYRAPKFVWTVRSREALDTAHALGECPIFEEVNEYAP